ncbi:MAG: hypothetical protein MJ145_03015 [Clostridia bacterium]|nr:hypothetical protein [Clostridia bacterium]
MAFSGLFKKEEKKEVNTVEEPKRFNSYIRSYALIKNISYDEAKEYLDKIKEEYGLTYGKYLNNKLWAYKDPTEALEMAVYRKESKEENYEKFAGTSLNMAMSDLEEKIAGLKAKYEICQKKLNMENYVDNKLYELDDEAVEQFFIDRERKEEEELEMVSNLTGWHKGQVKLDITLAQALHGLGRKNYMACRCWELSHEEMAGFARDFDSKYVTHHYNEKSGLPILRYKEKFATEYGPFLGRKFWINEEDADYDSFLEFIDGVKEIFCKPVNMSGGYGAMKFDLQAEDSRKLYDQLMAMPRYICEECVYQHEDIAKVNSSCLNTLRVVALQDEKGVHILDILMRFGNGGLVDNLSADGMVVHVDKGTGTIDTNAFDYAGNAYEKHPISGVKFKGYKLPNWDKVLSLVEAATKHRDDINFVGWDVAITQDNALIIEGNNSPGFGLNQKPYVPSQEGRRFLFKDYIDPEIYKCELKVSKRLDKEGKRGHYVFK